MKTSLLLTLWLGLAVRTFAGDPAASYDWRKLAESGSLLGGELRTIDGRAVLRISNTNALPLQVQLLRIDQPAITDTVYALTGEVRYDRVEGTGYLEMNNYFAGANAGPSAGPFFSRTLAEAGEMRKIAGTANWRRFLLPFDRTGASGAPTRLELNVFLPARGTVYVGPLQLQGLGNQGLAGAVLGNAWWSNRAAGVIGGLMGALVGCLAAVLARLSAQARARSFVLGALQAMVVLGALLGIAAAVALVMRQPYAVWFPLGLGALLLLGIMPARLRECRKQYEEKELRRMASVDA